jgi:hypothetical protein
VASSGPAEVVHEPGRAEPAPAKDQRMPVSMKKFTRTMRPVGTLTRDGSRPLPIEIFFVVRTL